MVGERLDIAEVIEHQFASEVGVGEIEERGAPACVEEGMLALEEGAGEVFPIGGVGRGCARGFASGGHAGDPEASGVPVGGIEAAVADAAEEELDCIGRVWIGEPCGDGAEAKGVAAEGFEGKAEVLEEVELIGEEAGLEWGQFNNGGQEEGLAGGLTLLEVVLNGFEENAFAGGARVEDDESIGGAEEAEATLDSALERPWERGVGGRGC